MRSSKPLVRPATRADIDKFSKHAGTPTVKAWVGELGGQIIAIGGLAFTQGRWFAFCDLEEEARKHKMTIARTAKMVMHEANKMGIRFVYAERNPHEIGAERWLKSLGFEIDPRSNYLFRRGR